MVKRGKSSGVSVYIGKRLGTRLVIEACRGVEDDVDVMRWIVQYRTPYGVVSEVYGIGDTEKELLRLLRTVEKYVREFKKDYREFEYDEYIEKLNEEDIKREIVDKLNTFEDGIVNLLIYAIDVPYKDKS